MRAITILLAAATLLTACASPVEYEDWWLDSPAVNDPSLDDPSFRVSTRPGLGAADRGRPVIIAVHGFTASTFEWSEFREYAEAGPTLVSLVLLGGHGRTIEEFRGSAWREWGEPILDEYRALVAQGYTNISIAASSTGGALVLEQIASGRFANLPAPRNLFLVDPIVVPGDKNLTLIPLLRHLVTNVTTDGTEEERRYWYTNRPAAALAELYDLVGRVRSQLAQGVTLPTGTRAKVYKTSGDETADPVSALLIYRGLRTSTGERVDVQMLDSDLHVFTRLRARNPALVTDADRARQLEAFQEMVHRAGS
jgi:carboxylesterase